MLFALVIVPLVLAAVAWVIPSAGVRRWLVPVGGLLHAALAAVVVVSPPPPALEGWLVVGQLGRVLLGFISSYFFLCSLYAPAYLAEHPDRRSHHFCAAMLFFLSMMTLIILSHHLGLMWVAMEATTLAAAPLVFFNRSPRALEATWKYLLIGSVGIALALLGSFFLAYSALHEGLGSSLLFEDLVRNAPRLSKPWLHAAFVVLFVGYGTKMGLAPMHTWKPDAYGEAPGLAGALLAGGLTNCAFLAIMRFHQVVIAAGEGAFARQVMVVMGLLSMSVAAVFMVRQRDFKRMLAYSSVEHMGILILGLGIGGLGAFGSLLHMINNGFTKGVLFLSAGNIQRAYSSKLTDQVGGALRAVPVSAALFVAGFFAITGSPPFGPFVSELTILNAAIGSGRYVVAGLFLLLLAVVFVGMGATVMAVVQGPPSEQAPPSGYRERFGTTAPVFLFLSVVLVLGCWIPGPVDRGLRQAAIFLETGR